MIKIELVGGPEDGKIVNISRFQPEVCVPVPIKDINIVDLFEPELMPTIESTHRICRYEVKRVEVPLGFIVQGKYQG
jgi:hypothetical protein